MRIKSNFKDYYDGAMRLGMDTDTLWLRKPRTEHETFQWLPHWYDFMWRRSDDLVGYAGHAVVIGFCGKLYGALVLEARGKGRKPETRDETNKAICFNVAEVDTFVEANWKKKNVEAWRNRKKYYWECKDWQSSRRREAIEFFEKMKELQNKDHNQLFQDNHAPIFTITGITSKRAKSTITYHAQLKPYEFYRIMDPYTAFQELQMYFGVLVDPPKPIPKVSDADMLEAKGFDPRFSFRKDKSKKKK